MKASLFTSPSVGTSSRAQLSSLHECSKALIVQQRLHDKDLRLHEQALNVLVFGESNTRVIGSTNDCQMDFTETQEAQKKCSKAKEDYGFSITDLQFHNIDNFNINEVRNRSEESSKSEKDDDDCGCDEVSISNDNSTIPKK
ncbi:unnamed protein product [Ilex paraguariensis]|uniref:Uncharacterized protein n=1 Tax=Ilex paraguariensis TaxID=185542 RepID=A0ABC8SZ97_9AQUA